MALLPHKSPPCAPGCFRPVLSAHRAATRAFMYWLLYSSSKINPPKPLHPQETIERVLPTWQANLTTLLCVLTDITSLCTIPTFQSNSEKHWQLWDGESNCQSRHRRTRKADQGAMAEDTRDLTVNQSWGEGMGNSNTRYTVCPLVRRRKTVLCVQCNKAHIRRHQSGHYVLAVYRGDCFPLPPT